MARGACFREGSRRGIRYSVVRVQRRAPPVLASVFVIPILWEALSRSRVLCRRCIQVKGKSARTLQDSGLACRFNFRTGIFVDFLICRLFYNYVLLILVLQFDCVGYTLLAITTLLADRGFCHGNLLINSVVIVFPRQPSSSPSPHPFEQQRTENTMVSSYEAQRYDYLELPELN